jgi:RNA polymerase sigma factor (sigma-70 family)
MDYEDLDIEPRPRSERIPADVDLTALYLREVGSTPLLDRQKEVDLARELLLARKDFATAALKLPAACRSQVLEGTRVKRRAKQPWSLKQIESCHDLLRSYLKQDPNLRRNKAYISIVDAKRRLNRSRDAMIQANLRLVAHVAKKFCNQGMPFMDLVQEGNIGLMKAVEKFEHERGYKFSTYAFWWIKQAITRAIADKSRTIRVPVHLLEKVRKVQRASQELERELGRQPKAQEIADKTQLPVKAVTDILGPGQND